MRYRDNKKKLKEGQKRYSVGGVLAVSIYTEVVASSPEEARELAMQRGILSLCHQCASGEPDVEWVTSGELDGEPEPYDDQTDLEVIELED